MAANLTTPETTRSGHFHTTRDGTTRVGSTPVLPTRAYTAYTIRIPRVRQACIGERGFLDRDLHPRAAAVFQHADADAAQRRRDPAQIFAQLGRPFWPAG